MIPNVVFIGLRYFFLALLYIFLILVLRAIFRDINAPESAASPRFQRWRKQVAPHLLVVAGEKGLGSKHQLPDEVLMGRTPDSDIFLDDTYASQHHARVFRDNDSFYVEDLGSTNGTYVNGRRISYPFELRSGDRIKIGKTVFEFKR